MEDSNGMTIEFLRARLLSERSISRTARQRADELAKRVDELEEQLKIVSLQRMKAEKATENVLAILGNHETSDVSEAFDSGSDHESTPCESEVGHSSVKEENTAANVKLRRNDVKTFSGSEFESSPLNGRSLSWKSGKDSPNARENKYMDSSRRRCSSLASSGSSSPKRVGKSCRRIRRRENRSAVGELQEETSMLPLQGNEVASHSEEGSENREEQVLVERLVPGVLENQRVTGSHNCNGRGGDKDMERALEHQAELIGRYEAEEKAQREWEEKFRESNNGTPDSYDPGNHSDVTEERDEIKAPPPLDPAKTFSSRDQGSKLGAVDVCFNKESEPPTGFQSPPNSDKGCLQDQQNHSNMIAYKSPASEFDFSMVNGKHDQDFSGGQYPSLHSSQHCRNSSATPENHSGQVSTRAGNSLGKGEASGKRNELALIPHETSDKLGPVLEALQQAKLSLKQTFNSLPLLEGGSAGKAIEPYVPALRTRDRFEVPVGCNGFFQLPTDFQFEATNRANFLGSDSRLNISNLSPEPAGEKFFPSPYVVSRSSTFTGDRFLNIPTFPYMEIRAGVPTQTPVLEPSLDSGLSSSGRYTYLDSSLSAGLPSSSKYTYPAYPLYPDLVPRVPLDEGLARSLPSREVGIRPATNFSFYGDHTRPNMYR